MRRVETRAPRPIPLSFLNTTLCREAMRKHDISQLFRILNLRGVSQRRIAHLTGQAQSEIYEIIAGRRVTAYTVLDAIAKGLEIPRGWLGIAWDDTEPTVVQALQPATGRAVRDAWHAIDRVARALRVDVLSDEL